MPDAEGLASNAAPLGFHAGVKCNLLSMHMPAANFTTHLINHSIPYLLNFIQVLHHKVSQLPAHNNPPSIRMSTKAGVSKSTRPSKPRGRLLRTPHPGAQPHHLQPPLPPPAPLAIPQSSLPPSLMWYASLNSFTTLLPKVPRAGFKQSWHSFAYLCQPRSGHIFGACILTGADHNHHILLLHFSSSIAQPVTQSCNASLVLLTASQLCSRHWRCRHLRWRREHATILLRNKLTLSHSTLQELTILLDVGR